MYRIIGADGKEYGPISGDQLRQWIAQNRANATTRVLAEGTTEWKTLGALPEFSALFGARPQAANPSAPAPFPTTTVFIPKTNGFAVAGLILGICSLTVGLCCYGVPFNVLGLIFSILALVQINGNPDRYTGKGLAITGIVLCLLSMVLSVILLIIVAASSGWNGVKHHGASL